MPNEMKKTLRRLRLLPVLAVLPLLLLGACGSVDPEDGGDGGVLPAGPVALSTARAAYRPGEPVTITLDGQAPDGARVRYKHLGAVIDDAPATGDSWRWTPPGDDFKGYMAEVYRPGDGTEEVLATVAVDVSSRWTRFPRYGFLSHYGDLSDAEIAAVVDDLNRHHINGLQFYDWHYKHHRPLAGTAESPQPVWKNIFNEDVHLSTVARYIEAAHAHGMQAMFYNLIFGALDDAAADGVAAEWYLFTDPNHADRDRHPLPKPLFKSDIFLTNPADPGWQDYLIAEHRKVYAALDFDGFHMDQLGDRGSRYAYDGTPVNLSATFGPFVAAMQAAHPGKYHVLNAVNQYGQAGIAASPADFLYTEVWHPHESYADLAAILQDNSARSAGEKNTVLAAYVNYGRADRPDVFNTPSVLFTNAVIFAFGGAHLELGEHMLAKEFFPNDNLLMKKDLREALVAYYDFLVAYQNVLRDGGSFNAPALATSGALALGAWPPRRGEVAVAGKEVGARQVIHLLNFTDATTLSWRDDPGIQAYPFDRKDVPLVFTSSRPVARIWYATPDRAGGASTALAFTQTGDAVTFTLPFLKYWSMIVVEYA